MPLSENHFGSSSLEKQWILNAVSYAPYDSNDTSFGTP